MKLLAENGCEKGCLVKKRNKNAGCLKSEPQQNGWRAQKVKTVMVEASPSVTVLKGRILFAGNIFREGHENNGRRVAIHQIHREVQCAALPYEGLKGLGALATIENASHALAGDKIDDLFLIGIRWLSIRHRKSAEAIFT